MTSGYFRDPGKPPGFLEKLRIWAEPNLTLPLKYVCMYVCMCACMYACMHAHMYIYTCVYTHLCVHRYVEEGITHWTLDLHAWLLERKQPPQILELVP